MTNYLAQSRPLLICATVIAALSAGGYAEALTRNSGSDSRTYVSGGVGAAETRILRAERDRYSLRILTAAKPSGAYLADVHVRIQDASGHSFFDGELDGPWLMIDLPAGHYSIEAERHGQARRQNVSIIDGQSRELVIRFPSSASVLSATGAATSH